MNFAEVAINVAVNNTFHYHIPDDLKDELTLGHLVRVAFGTAMQPAVIVDLHEELPSELADIKTKPILELLDPLPLMTWEHLELALWMSETYMAPPGACVWLMLPPGLTGKSTRTVHLLDSEAEGATPLQQRILDVLHVEAPMNINALKRQVASPSVQRIIREFTAAGVVAVESQLATPTASNKTVRTVMRTMPDDEVVDVLATLKRAPKQSKVFAYIARFDYPVDVPDVYDATGATSADLNNLASRGLVEFGQRIIFRDSLADRDFVPSAAPPLTQGQRAVWGVIQGVMGRESIPTTNLTSKLDDSTNSIPTPNLIDSVNTGDDSIPTPNLIDSVNTGDDSIPTPNPINPSLTRPEFGEGTSRTDESILANRSSLDAELLPEQSKSAAKNPPLNTGEVARFARRRGFDDGNYRMWRTTSKMWRDLKPRAREMRHRPTPAEEKLWRQLRRKQLNGYKFRRQHPVAVFIVDFYCPDAKLVIEVDGDIHKEQQEYDEMRQAYLEYLGLRVLRFHNDEVSSNIDGVLEAIGEALDATTPRSELGEGTKALNKFLLHGVTGSGKTEIYLQAIAATLEQGRQAIFLVPEIALTPQTIRRVAQRFPEQVAVVHGSLSTGERYDTWRRARQGEIGVIVGTRSALFTPLPDVGVIILDEEHDHSYKQAPPINPPYYHARAAAEELADLNDAILILGSATPDIETYYRAKRGELHYLQLPDRIMGHQRRVSKQAQRYHLQPRYLPDEGEAVTIDLPPVSVIDMRDELKHGNRSMFSHLLQDELKGVIERNEQAILFLNRRGQSTYVFCRDCGYVVECSNCDTPMTYHRHGEAMRCHHCGNKSSAPQSCPACGSDRIRYFGAGTQHVEAELHKLLPDVKSVRWDADTVDKPDKHEAILARFISGAADVIVGTQMVAKGLDLPLVTLVGVISADPGLALPDFRAHERVFQLLMQVAGRAGRGILGGKVVIQTYQPQHVSIQTAAHHDYLRFYEQEIAARREMGYPPFRRMARLLVQHEHPIEAQRQVEDAAAILRHHIETRQLTDTSLIGPAPSFFSRLDRHYRWQILVRSVDPLKALEGLQLRTGWYLDIDPVDVL